MPVTTVVHLSNACHLSLSVYICLMPVTIGVYLSNASHYQRIFVQHLSRSAHICPMRLPNHRKPNNSSGSSLIWNSSPDLPDLPDLPEVSHLLWFGTSTRAGGQDDVSSNKLPQITHLARKKNDSTSLAVGICAESKPPAGRSPILYSLFSGLAMFLFI